MGLCIPTPGWLSVQLMPAGSPLGIAMLGIAVTLHGGLAGDEEVNATYDELAQTDDTVFAVNAYYRALEEQYPFLAGALGGITGWTENPLLHQYDQVRTIAATLATVSWSQTEPEVGGDILGRVYAQMLAIGDGRTRVFDYVTIDESFEEWTSMAMGRTLGHITDVWCGPGTRALGAVRYCQMIGQDIEGVPVRLNDPNPIAIAMAGLNMVSYQVGPQVTLTSSAEWSQKWGTSTFYGTSPSIRKTLPPDLEMNVGLPSICQRKMLP